jgi:protein-disulfide isomerase
VFALPGNRLNLFDVDLSPKHEKGGLRLHVVCGSLILVLVGPTTLRAQFGDRECISVKVAEPIAMIGDQPIYEKEISAAIQGQLEHLRQQEYRLQEQGLNELLGQKLLEGAAKKRGVPIEQLLQAEVDRKVSEPNQGEMEAFYLAQKEPTSGPFDSSNSVLYNALKRAKITAARRNYVEHLRDEAKVTLLLSSPRVEVNHDSTRVRGNLNASVTIVEFADFSCPFCRSVEATLTEILAKHNGNVNLAYRDFPLSESHPLAESAAEASRCAGDQGKFWEYHDLLFSNSGKISYEDLLQNAAQLKLDEVRFRHCVSTHSYAGKVEQDLQDGVRAGVRGTPAFFINGVLLEGIASESDFEKVINQVEDRSRRERDDRYQQVEVRCMAHH